MPPDPQSVMATQPAPAHFGLLRHAPTLWNRQGRIQGQQNSELTSSGTLSARQWGEALAEQGWQRMLASDLGRATATAAWINQALGLPLACDARLREQDWGRWTGRIVSEIRASGQADAARILAAGWEFHPPGGEPRWAVLARAVAALCDAARQWPGQKILVISHEGLIKPLLYHLLQQSPEPSGPPWRVLPGHLHHLSCDGYKVRLERLNALALPCSDDWTAATANMN